MSAERGFLVRVFLEVKVNRGIGDCSMRGFDRIDGIYRIGR